MLLAGDIGGTKTLLALYDENNGPLKPLLSRRYPSAQYRSLTEIVQLFMQEAGAQVDCACFGVAGPVIEGEAHITNLNWQMKVTELSQALAGAPVYLLNDLQAIANAVLVLSNDDLHCLNEGDAVPEGPIAVIAPGTGLGEAYLTWQHDHYVAHPSEGGHVEFAPHNEMQLAMLSYLLERIPHVSYERVISGIGLPNIYAFMRAQGEYEEPASLRDALAAAAEATPVIIQHALQTPHPIPICLATVKMFIDILAAEAGNLALKVLSTGGVFIGGGIPPRILPLISRDEFMANFTSKGRMSTLLYDMPVHIILNPDAALIGAAHFALQQIDSPGVIQ